MDRKGAEGDKGGKGERKIFLNKKGIRFEEISCADENHCRQDKRRI